MKTFFYKFIVQTFIVMLAFGLVSCVKSTNVNRTSTLELSGTLKTLGSARSATLVLILDKPITDPEINSPDAKQGVVYPPLTALAVAGRHLGDLYEKQGSKVQVRGELHLRDAKANQEPRGFTQMFNYDPRIKYQVQVSWYKILEDLTIPDEYNF